jgi:hypothetical protein
MITVEVLAEIETLLQHKLGLGADFIFDDYFCKVFGITS